MSTAGQATRVAVIALAAAITATPVALAGEDLQLSFNRGRVTVVATEVPLRTILDEWARVGDTTFVETSHIPNQPVSVEMIDVPEGEALRVLLRAAGGYVVAPRASAQLGSSTYDRVLIMATARRRTPRRTAFPQPSFTTEPMELDEPMAPDETAPPGWIVEPDDTEFDQLELLEQLRGRYQSEAPPPDLFSQPSAFTPDQPETQSEGDMQATPRPGMISSSPNESQRSGRPTRPVRPQRDDP